MKILLSTLLLITISFAKVDYFEYTTNQSEIEMIGLNYNNSVILIKEQKYQKAKLQLKNIFNILPMNHELKENVIFQLAFTYMKTQDKVNAMKYFHMNSKVKSAKKSYIILLSNWYLFQYTEDIRYLYRNKDLYAIFNKYITKEKDILVHINGDLIIGDYKGALEKYHRIDKTKQNPEHLLYLNLLNDNKKEAKANIIQLREEGVKNLQLEKDLINYNLFLNLQAPDAVVIKDEYRYLKRVKVKKPDFTLNYKVINQLLNRDLIEEEIKNDVLSPLFKLNYISNYMKYQLDLDYDEEIKLVKTEAEHTILKNKIKTQKWLFSNYHKDNYIVYYKYKQKITNKLNFQESYNLALMNIKLGKYINSLKYLKKSFYLKPQKEFSALFLLLIDKMFPHDYKEKLNRLEKKSINSRLINSNNNFIKYIYYKLILLNDKQANKYSRKIMNVEHKKTIKIINNLYYSKNTKVLKGLRDFDKIIYSIINENNHYLKMKIIQEYFLLNKNPIIQEGEPLYLTDLKIKLAYISGVLKDKEIEYHDFDKPSILRGNAIIKIFNKKYFEGKEILEKLIIDYNISDITTNKIILFAYKQLGDQNKVEIVLKNKNITKEMFKIFILSKIKRKFEEGKYEEIKELISLPIYQKNTSLIIDSTFLVNKLLNNKNKLIRERYLLKQK